MAHLRAPGFELHLPSGWEALRAPNERILVGAPADEVSRAGGKLEALCVAFGCSWHPPDAMAAVMWQRTYVHLEPES